MENFNRNSPSQVSRHRRRRGNWCVLVCVFFQQLEKVRAPAAASSDDLAVQAGAYLWAMTQSHRVCQEFMSAQWRLHSSIAGIINYHVISLWFHYQLTWL